MKRTAGTGWLAKKSSAGCDESTSFEEEEEVGEKEMKRSMVTLSE